MIKYIRTAFSMKRKGYIYILTNKYNNALYVGVTNNLVRRVNEHKLGVGSKFTSKYKIDKLVYYEIFDNIEEAIAREKQIKSGSRAKKVKLIESINPQWKELEPV